MVRGTFANVRIKTLWSLPSKAALRSISPTCEEMSIYDAAMSYKDKDAARDLAGQEYGTGSSRVLGSKGRAHGVNAVRAQSFERIHRRISWVWACASSV